MGFHGKPVRSTRLRVAIYSLNHQPVGKATQARPYTAAAHVRYITRPSAVSRIEAARIPSEPEKARSYLRQMEDGDRKNARVIDKVRLALPVELDAAQRAALVRGFAEELTQGRAAWLAAFHDKGKDAHNPHCHLVVRDRDVDTGRRVIGTSEAGSTDRIRVLWEAHANRALEQAGREERIDHRTLAAQGITRAPTIHEGPRARAMQGRGVAPQSRQRVRRNGRGAKSRTRVVDYPAIDRGQSRTARNRDTEAAYWAAVDADRRRREFETLGYGADARRYAAKEAEMAKKKEPLLDQDEVEKPIVPRFVGNAILGAAERLEAAERAFQDFLHDPSKPVKTGKDAPVWTNNQDFGRPLTPQEQQEMSLPEAIGKKVVKPAFDKAVGWLKGQEAPQQPGMAPEAKGERPSSERAPQAEEQPRRLPWENEKVPREPEASPRAPAPQSQERPEVGQEEPARSPSFAERQETRRREQERGQEPASESLSFAERQERKRQQEPQPAKEPESGRPPSFAERQEQRRQELESDPAAREARDARLADQREASRRDDKEQGR